MKKYWETEAPVEVNTGKNILKHYPKAGKLQISMPEWKNETGETRRGKMVVLDIAALQASREATKIILDLVPLDED